MLYVCGHDEQKFEMSMYQPFFTLSYCYEKILYDYNSYISPHNQSVVTTVIKEVNIRHPSATKDNVHEQSLPFLPSYKHLL